MPKRGENIYKRKDGRWEGRYRVGFRKDGKPRYHSIYGHSYQDVKSALIPLKASPTSFNSSGHLTVKALFEEWLAAVRLSVKASTYANYRMKADKHILPAFGNVAYELLTPDQVHEFIRTKLENGLSAKYVADIVILLKSMAKYMMRIHGYRNQIENIILPKNKPTELFLFSQKQQTQFSRFLMTHLNPTTLCILLSLHMGLRIGEACGLKWEDVDFEKCVLSVKRTVQRVHSGYGTRILIDSPKSKASRRIIPIPLFLIDALQKNRNDPACFILSGNKNAIEPRTLQHRFKVLLKKAGLPSTKYHSLRHMFATNCVRAGFDVRTLSEVLGHSSVTTTLSLYVHSSMDRKKECMALLSPSF